MIKIDFKNDMRPLVCTNSCCIYIQMSVILFYRLVDCQNKIIPLNDLVTYDSYTIQCHTE